MQIQHIDEILSELPPEEAVSEPQDEEGENWEDVETSDEEEEDEAAITEGAKSMDMSWYYKSKKDELNLTVAKNEWM